MSEKSFHDRVAAVVAGQKVEELKARHAYLHGMNRGLRGIRHLLAAQ